jgi:AraC family transcriptional regulator of adaptative response/methylated-DNA-[protein]-cysteine methyltransferase
MNEAPETESRDARRIHRALLLLAEHWREQPGLDWLAAQVGLSEFHLQRLFTRRVGISPKRYVQCLTRDAARNALADARSLLEAAHDCGLSGTARLHDLFVRYEGMTPGDFKQAAAGLVLREGECDTPFGPAYAVWAPHGLNRLEFFADGEHLAGLRQAARADFAGAGWRPLEPADRGRLANAFVPQPAADCLPLWVSGSAFQLKVWEALLAIPSGRCVSYGDLADALGATSTAAVGDAVAGNALAWLIPCHRVIREDGRLGSARWGQARKRAMLAWEAGRSGESAT